MTKEISIVHGGGLDQPLPVFEDAFDLADAIMKKAIDEGNPDVALRMGAEIIESIQIRGIALAHLLYRLWEEWDKFGLGSTFEEAIFDNWGFSKQTVQKYVSIWKSTFANPNVPEEVKPSLKERPINTLRRVIRPVNNGYLTAPSDWRELASTVDDSEFKQKIEELSGTAAAGHPTLQIFLYDDGTLVAVDDYSSHVKLGILRTSTKDLNNPIRFKAIDRIKRGAGILPI